MWAPSLVGMVPLRRKRQPTPVFLLGESHGERSLMGCGPWSLKESDTTEATKHSTRGKKIDFAFWQRNNKHSSTKIIQTQIKGY